MKITGTDSILGNIGEIGGWISIIHSLIETIRKGGDVYEKLPEAVKQKMPGLLGLSLADERIFNAVVALLAPEQQIILMRFLNEKCKDFQRNRFINIVAGMEVIPGTPKSVEKKFDPKTKALVSEKITDEKPRIDLRKQFLKQFADIIISQFGGNLNKAYKHCIGGRMILENPYYQKALDAWTKNCNWFEGVVLKMFGAKDTAELFKKVRANASGMVKTIEKKLKKDPYRGFWAEALGFSRPRLPQFRLPSFRLPTLPNWLNIRRRTP